MIKLLTTARRVVKQAALSVAAPAALFATAVAPAEPVIEAAAVGDDAPAPTAEEVEQAAKVYFRAADSARRADREKRAAKKVLDRVTAGVWGSWKVERVQSSRQVADLDAIREIFKAHGLGPVPMRTAAPSLKVTVAETAAPVAGELVAA